MRLLTTRWMGHETCAWATIRSPGLDALARAARSTVPSAIVPRLTPMPRPLPCWKAGLPGRQDSWAPAAETIVTGARPMSDISVMNRRDLLRRAILLAGGVGLGSASFELLARTKATARFFSAAHYELLQEVADIIIPRTDTPGAVDAGVPA